MEAGTESSESVSEPGTQFENVSTEIDELEMSARSAKVISLVQSAMEGERLSSGRKQDRIGLRTAAHPK